MPRKTRHPSPQERAHRRKLRDGVPTPATHPPAPLASEAAQESIPEAGDGASPLLVPSPPPAEAPTPAQAAPQATSLAALPPRNQLAQNPLLVKELQRIGVLGVVIFAILVTLSLLLR